MRIAAALFLSTVSFTAFSQEPPPQYKALLTHCEGVQNSFQCARAIEQAQAKGVGGRFFERSKDVLRVRTLKKVISLTDRAKDDADAHLYSYLTYLPEQRLHVLHLQFYEGTAYAVVHHKSAEIAQIDGFPLISPDARRFIAISSAGESGYNPNSVEVWRVSNGIIWPEYRYEPSAQSWQPKTAYWLDSTTVALEGNCGTDTVTPAKCPSLKATFRGGRWRVIWQGSRAR